VAKQHPKTSPKSTRVLTDLISANDLKTPQVSSFHLPICLPTHAIASPNIHENEQTNETKRIPKKNVQEDSVL